MLLPNTRILVPCILSGVLLFVGQSCSDGQQIVAPGQEVKSDKQRIMAPDVSDSELHQLVSGDNAFAMDVYHALVEKAGDGEVFFSPYSISLALAMTWAGARNETESQMSSTLHFSLGQDRLHPTFNYLDLALMSRGKSVDGQDGDGFHLSVVNSIWGQEGHPFLGSFLDMLAENYGAGLHVMDFGSNPDACTDMINRWVEEYTDQRIKNLLPPDALDIYTKLVLVNAIYFKASWAIPFEEYDTSDGEFHTLAGKDITVQMMHQSSELDYVDGDGFKAVELPYDGRQLSMVLLLPEQGRFSEVEQGLNPQMLEEMISSMDLIQVRISLPKWEYSSDSIGLNSMLSNLGMPLAFERGKADFSGMDDMRDLFISRVFHKAFISVDEAGTEAAAASAVVMTDGGMADGGTEVQVKTFRADRPFIYFIRDIDTGSILFMGRVTAPSIHP